MINYNILYINYNFLSYLKYFAFASLYFEGKREREKVNIKLYGSEKIGNKVVYGFKNYVKKT